MGKWLFENHGQDARYNGPLKVCPLLSAQIGTGGNNAPLVVEAANENEHRGGGTVYEYRAG
jgi:hypothetical protein